MMSVLRLLVVWCCLVTLDAATQEVALRAPLTTVVRLPGKPPTSAFTMRAVVQVPAMAPADLGVGAFVADRHGQWFQRVSPLPLHPGANPIAIDLSPGEPLTGQPHHAAWTPAAASQTSQAGLFLWSASASTVAIGIDDLVAEESAVAAQVMPGLHGLELPGLDGGTIHLEAGARWQCAVMPQPFPVNPFDPAEFSLDAVFMRDDGTVMRIPGFACEPISVRDRGDHEVAEAAGPMRFLVRWRPPTAGRWSAHLEARWDAHDTVAIDLPPIVVSGQDHDDVVRVDADDPRFFAVGGKWFWPIGMNLHSTFDTRSRDRLGTALTPPRGTSTYRDLLRRLAAAGGNATEIWMSSWNLALEWNAAWPGYEGMGRYAQANAARLDAVLDAAWANGIRVNLVINNHGQASPNADREWKDHPWNKENGGLLTEPYELFRDPRSLVAQANLRRYLVARYGDHPALLGWKLWSEINLTAVGESQRRTWRSVPGNTPLAAASDRLQTLVAWHEGAASNLHTLDAYHHPVTTHWSGDYRKPNPEVCALPGINYICIDAYHGGRDSYDGSTLVDLLWYGMQDPTRGLGRFNKPLVVTEFGGSSGGTSDGLLAAEHNSAAWAALVSGTAGMPFLWWWEWIDQGERWQPYGAIARFIAGEDLRGAQARAVVLAADGQGGPWWARAWVRPGRMLGYVADHRWTGEGGAGSSATTVTVRIGSQVAPGPCRVEWWDAGRGIVIEVSEFVHPGGALELHAPPFLHQIAFKLLRPGVNR